MKYCRGLIMTLATLATGVAGAADQRQSGMTEITVTARKIEERLQEVPIAVSAFTAEDMKERNMQELEDIALGTPGFSFEDYGGGFGVPVIRSGSQQRIQDLDQTTSVFLDGIYLPRQYMVDFGTGGFERIEILKGPQSALFGRNAFLGAVNYVSRRPGDSLAADVDATIGTDSLYQISGDISGPIIGDRLGVRLYGSYSEFDGTWENQHPNAGPNYGKRGTTDNLGGSENSTIGINVNATLVERLKLQLDYYRVDRFQEANKGIRVESSAGDTNCSPTLPGGANRFYCGELPDKFTPLPGGTPPGLETVVDPRSYNLDVGSNLFRAGLDLEISDRWNVVYQYGYSDTEVTSAGPGDRDPLLGSPDFFVPGNRVNYVNDTPNGTNDYNSHELRVEFKEGQWSAFIGGFTSRIRDFDKFDLGLAPLLGTDPYVITPDGGIENIAKFSITNARTEVKTNAVFGRVGWQSADGFWRVGVEARYADEKKELDSNTLSATNPIFNGSWNSFTPRFTVDYRLDDRHMLYGSIAKGEKAGGFNNTVYNEAQRRYDPDQNWSYELGSKNEWLDGRLRANIAAFYIDWTDLQINSTPIDIPPGATPPAIVGNTGGATIWGIELEGAWAALDNLEFDYGISYARAEYTSGSKSARIGLIGGCDGIVCPADGSISGNQLQRQPEFQMSLGATVYGMLPGDWEWSLRGDVNYQTKEYVDELNLAWLPDRTLVNARFQVKKDQWTAALWAKNLLDKEYVAYAFFTAVPTATSYTPAFAQKLTAGLTVSYAFK